ncbi:22049_t:CDS:1, partial [Gigaspora rosea]
LSTPATHLFFLNNSVSSQQLASLLLLSPQQVFVTLTTLRYLNNSL